MCYFLWGWHCTENPKVNFLEIKVIRVSKLENATFVKLPHKIKSQCEYFTLLNSDECMVKVHSVRFCHQFNVFTINKQLKMRL